MASETYRLEGWERLQRGALAVGLVAAALCGIGAYFSAAQFFQSYLLAYVFWTGIALGCLGVMMIHNLTGGAWGIVIRRLLESGMRTLPLMLLLFLPLLLGLQSLYEWARPETLTEDATLASKSAYLNVPFFVLRSAVYFAVWIGAALLLTRWSREQDRTGDPKLEARLRGLSGPGLILYVLTITFASIDWIMSLEPHWYSSIFGVHFLGGHAVSAFALVVLLAGVFGARQPFARFFQPAYLHDLGNLLLAFVMLWAYFAYSQLLIIWSGNLPEEVTWYVRRTRGGWEWVAVLLAAGHFLLPFLLLLSRTVKRRIQALGAIAVLLLIMRLLDIFWYTAPAFHPDGFHLHWMDLIAPIAIGGLWVAAFLGQLRPVALLPHRAPGFKEMLESDGH